MLCGIQNWLDLKHRCLDGKTYFAVVNGDIHFTSDKSHALRLSRKQDGYDIISLTLNSDADYSVVRHTFK